MSNPFTLFTLNILTPQLITILVLKFGQIHLTSVDLSKKVQIYVKVDPAHTPRPVMTGLDLLC